MGKNRIYLRADGNAQMGLGHVFRLLAVADMVSELYEIIFIIRDPIAKLVNEINSLCNEIIVINAERISHREEPQFLIDTCLSKGDLLVLDGYHFETIYQNELKAIGLKIISIDDIFDCHFSSNIVINHAGGLSSSVYDLATETKLYTGLEYAILRKEFLSFAKNRGLDKFPAYPKDRCNLFICLGGADPNNDTMDVLIACAKKKYQGIIYLVLGAAYQYRKVLNEFIVSSPLRIQILSNLSAEEMVHYMALSDMAITSASTISYEYMSIGGTLYLKLIAENQRAIKNYFIREKLAFDFDTDFMEVNTEQGNYTMKKQYEYLDGNSGNRILKLIKELHQS